MGDGGNRRQRTAFDRRLIESERSWRSRRACGPDPPAALNGFRRIIGRWPKNRRDNAICFAGHSHRIALPLRYPRSASQPAPATSLQPGGQRMDKPSTARCPDPCVLENGPVMTFRTPHPHAIRGAAMPTKLIAIVVIIVVLAAGAWWFFGHTPGTAVLPGTATAPSATTSTPASPNAPAAVVSDELTVDQLYREARKA